MDGINYKDKAKDIRLKCLNMVKNAGKGHLGGTFSIIDILTVLYYGNFLKLTDNRLYRDKVIIGKGHANLAFFSIWNDLGYMSDEILNTYGNDNGLGGQLDLNLEMVDNITGSLGHAIGIASGIALANRLDNSDYKVFAIVGDGEMEEGSIWEALDFATKHKINNLICIVDRNRLSVTDFIEDDNMEQKVNAFGWHTHVIDGHNHEQIEFALKSAIINNYNKPKMIIADTVKGKGVSFMENNAKWHHGCPTESEYKQALKELNNV